MGRSLVSSTRLVEFPKLGHSQSGFPELGRISQPTSSPSEPSLQATGRLEYVQEEVEEEFCADPGGTPHEASLFKPNETELIEVASPVKQKSKDVVDQRSPPSA